MSLLLLSTAGGQSRAAEGPERDARTPVAVVESGVSPVVHLYFADPQGRYLQAEERIFSGSENENDRGRFILEALIKGPRSGLTRTVPPGTRLRGFYLAPKRRAFVDLSDAITEQHPGGCLSEILTLYSIVNSLVLNMPDVATVKILIGGRDVSTLAGHIDIRFPFTADMALIR